LSLDKRKNIKGIGKELFMNDSDKYKKRLKKILFDFTNTNTIKSENAVIKYNKLNPITQFTSFTGYYPHWPSSLYKYRQFDKYWTKWMKGDIYLSCPENWNDFSDSLCITSDDTYDDSDSESIRTAFRRNRTGCCFSETKLSMPMWSFYAGNHSGFAIEYNFNRIQYNVPHYNFYIQPVIYDNNIKFPVNLIKKYLDDAKNIKLPPFPMMVKSDQWAYEKEWRMFGKRTSTGDLEGNYPEAKEHISAIYFGLKTSKSDIRMAIEFMREVFHDNLPPLYKMQINPKHNQLAVSYSILS
jgi:hypothetical protein